MSVCVGMGVWAVVCVCVCVCVCLVRVHGCGVVCVSMCVRERRVVKGCCVRVFVGVGVYTHSDALSELV